MAPNQAPIAMLAKYLYNNGWRPILKVATTIGNDNNAMCDAKYKVSHVYVVKGAPNRTNATYRGTVSMTLANNPINMALYSLAMEKLS